MVQHLALFLSFFLRQRSNKNTVTQIYRCKQKSQVDANKFSAKSYFIYNEK